MLHVIWIQNGIGSLLNLPSSLRKEVNVDQREQSGFETSLGQGLHIYDAEIQSTDLL